MLPGQQGSYVIILRSILEELHLRILAILLPVISMRLHSKANYEVNSRISIPCCSVPRRIPVEENELGRKGEL